LLESHRPIQLAENAWSASERSAEAVSEVLANGRATYGVNTGFGSLATTRIPTESPSRASACRRRTPCPRPG
jgi:histidine ammonia-lyase